MKPEFLTNNKITMTRSTNTVQIPAAPPQHSTYLSFIETGKNYAAALIFFLFSPFSIIAQDTFLGLTSNGGSQGRGTAFSIKNNGQIFRSSKPLLTGAKIQMETWYKAVMEIFMG
jgi:hypothetical protein